SGFVPEGYKVNSAKAAIRPGFVCSYPRSCSRSEGSAEIGLRDVLPTTHQGDSGEAGSKQDHGQRLRNGRSRDSQLRVRTESPFELVRHKHPEGTIVDIGGH